MTTQNQEQEHEFEVRIFGYGDCDRGLDGRLNSYVYIAGSFRVPTKEEAIKEGERIMRDAHQAARRGYDDFGRDEWNGVAVYHNGEIVWSQGRTYTDEEMELPWA